MIEAVGKNIIIDVDKVEEKTAGGLYVPDNAKDKPQRGTIVSICSDIEFGLDNKTLKVGDRVIFAKFSGTEVEDGDNKYLAITEDNLLAVIS